MLAYHACMSRPTIVWKLDRLRCHWRADQLRGGVRKEGSQVLDIRRTLPDPAFHLRLKV